MAPASRLDPGRNGDEAGLFGVPNQRNRDDGQAPTADFATRCDELFQTPGTFATLQELVARDAYPAFFAPVIPFEREAVRIHGWELGAVPGLLQTEDYARAAHIPDKERNQ